MLFFKQFKAITNYIKENFQNVNTPSDTIVTFSLPDGEPAVARYNNTGFEEEYGMAYGSVFIEYGDYKTECSTYTQAEETLENLVRDYGNLADYADDPTEAHFIQEADADSIASDVVRFLYDQFPEANFIGEGSLGDKMVLKFDFGKADKEAMRKELAERYGNRVSFGHGNTEYAPEIKFGAIIVNPPANTITEGVESMEQYVTIDNFPEWAVEPMVNGTWGDWITYYGEKQAKEDFAMIDKFMKENGLCDIIPPANEEYDAGRNEFNSRPAFGDATSTITVTGVKGDWKSLVDKYDLNDEADDTTELTEDAVTGVISDMGLTVEKKWYDGNKGRPVFDCKKPDGTKISIWVEPPYEAKVWLTEKSSRDNGLIEDITTVKDLEDAINSFADVERAVADDIDTAMMDHYDMMNGDIGDFEADQTNKSPVVEATTEEIVNAPEDVIELPADMSASDPLVEYLKALEPFGGWDPAELQLWAKDNRDSIYNNYNELHDLKAAVEKCLEDEKDRFYQNFKYESVNGARMKVFAESVRKLCGNAGQTALGEAVIKLASAINESAECTGDCVQLDDEPNFDVTIAVDTLDPNPAHYQVEGYDANDALEKVAEDLKAKGHLGYFEDNPTYPEDYFEVAGTFIPSWLVNIEKIA